MAGNKWITQEQKRELWGRMPEHARLGRSRREAASIEGIDYSTYTRLAKARREPVQWPALADCNRFAEYSEWRVGKKRKDDSARRAAAIGRWRRCIRLWRTAFGVTGELTLLVEMFSTVRYGTVQQRLRLGWSIEDALTRPVRYKEPSEPKPRKRSTEPKPNPWAQQIKVAIDKKQRRRALA